MMFTNYNDSLPNQLKIEQCHPTKDSDRSVIKDLEKLPFPKDYFSYYKSEY